MCHQANTPHSAELVQEVYWGRGAKRVKGHVIVGGGEGSRQTDRQGKRASCALRALVRGCTCRVVDGGETPGDR